MRYSRKSLERQVDELKATHDHLVKCRLAAESDHKREMEELRKRLQEREMDAKATVARASAQLIEALARMLSPGTF